MKSVVKIACVALLVGALGSVAGAQQESLLIQKTAPLRMMQVDRAHMPAADRDLLADSDARLARAARVFGYRVLEPGWLCKEVLTRDTPNYMMMSCRRVMASGRGAFVFTALIARNGSTVYVVPVMYGGAAPWKTAANMRVSREIFNHVVPERIAAKAVKATGDWMTLALTFTALAGDDSTVLAVPSTKPKWLMAPEPTIMLRNGASKRTVTFSDVSPVGGVRMWTLTLNDRGRIIGAKVKVRPDLTPQRMSTKAPEGKLLKNLPSPIKSAKPVPPVQN